MDILKQIIVSVAVVLVVLGSYAVLTHKDSNGNSPVLGALAGPDIPSPYLHWGGVRTYNAGSGLTAAASTTCSLQSPAATSTLVEAGINFDVASSTAAEIVEIGYSSNPFSTTTALSGTYHISSGAQAFVHASTAPAAGSNEIIPPNSYINFKLGQWNSATAPVGRCQAQFVDYTTR